MLTIRPLDAAGLRAVYPLIESSFPADECRPLRMMLSLMRRGLYEPLGVYAAEQLVGCALSLLPEGLPCVLLDYLAVVPDRRGQGLGGELLTLLRAWYAPRAACILIESEYPEHAPDGATAGRRLRFYERAGAVRLPQRVLLFGVDYAMLALPTGTALPEVSWPEVMLGVYRQTLPPGFFASQVKMLEA